MLFKRCAVNCFSSAREHSDSAGGFCKMPVRPYTASQEEVMAGCDPDGNSVSRDFIVSGVPGTEGCLFGSPVRGLKAAAFMSPLRLLQEPAATRVLVCK